VRIRSQHFSGNGVKSGISHVARIGCLAAGISHQLNVKTSITKKTDAKKKHNQNPVGNQVDQEFSGASRR
jgi:hypothetical protein